MIDKLLETVSTFLSSKGFLGAIVLVLFIVLVLIVQNPDRALKLKAIFLSPLYKWFKLGSKQYIAAQVGSVATDFIEKHIGNQLPRVAKSKIRIQWVSSPSDPILKTNGTLIIRLEDSNDQTRNIFSATRAAIPLVVCPTIRPNITKPLETAIDLTMLYKLADRLGKHSYPTLQKYFLTPETDNNQQAAGLLQKLRQLDKQGLFVSIFIEEIDKLGAYTFSNGENADKSESIIHFLEFLLAIATRDTEEQTPLDYISNDFKVSILLLARSSVAETRGVDPYIQRVHKKIQYADSIYIVTYPHQKAFLSRILSTLKLDNSITLIKNIGLSTLGVDDVKSDLTVTLFQKNFLAPDIQFQEKLTTHKIQNGNMVDGTVIDVSPQVAIVKIGDIDAFINNSECSWDKYVDCNDVYATGIDYKFMVKNIYLGSSRVELSNRIPSTDPWLSDVPDIGDEINVKVRFRTNDTYVSSHEERIQILIPCRETNLNRSDSRWVDKIIGSVCKVVIYDKIDSSRTLYASLVRLQPDFWRNLTRQFPKDMQTIGIIKGKYSNIIKVSLKDELLGEILPSSVTVLGLDYKEFYEKIGIGQRIAVRINKINVGQHQIFLDLDKSAVLRK